MVVVTMDMKLMMITIYGREAPLNRRRSQYGQRKIRPNKVGGKDHKMYDRQPTKNSTRVQRQLASLSLRLSTPSERRGPKTQRHE